MHDCVDGTRRKEKIEELEAERKRVKGKVVRDEWSVGESRAVERARGLVKGPSGGGGGGIGGIGLGGRRVRVVAPPDGTALEESASVP